MYLGIDIGGTKTALAVLDEAGVIQESSRFATPESYESFLSELSKCIDSFTTKNFVVACVGVPGKLDRTRGIALAFGRLLWGRVSIREDIHKFTHCPTIIENDANLAGLSEAMLCQQFRKVLYVTISTGIGTGFIVGQAIEPSLQDSEGGNMLLEHNGKLELWEDFASGRAIVQRFGKKAQEITDLKTWEIIAHNIALGLIDLIALTQPDVIVLGGSVGRYYNQFKQPLAQFLQAHENPLYTIPPIQEAVRPDQAVLYGCYDLARAIYASNA